MSSQGNEINTKGHPAFSIHIEGVQLYLQNKLIVLLRGQLCAVRFHTLAHQHIII